MTKVQLPFPMLDALPLGAHRLLVLTDEALFAHCGVRVMFTGRAGGVSEGAFASLNCGAHVGDDVQAVERNRALVCEAAGVTDMPLIVPNQVHGTNLTVVESADARQVERAQACAEQGADGVVVSASGVAALLNFADCLPLIVVSPNGRFAVVHAGWRGAVAHIAAKAVRELARGNDYEPRDFNAYIGPHIRQECFEVGAEVAEKFKAEFGDAALADAQHVDLSAAVMSDLLATGLVCERIVDAGICTKCQHASYYSYRATNGSCGRHAAFAVKT